MSGLHIYFRDAYLAIVRNEKKSLQSMAGLANLIRSTLGLLTYEENFDTCVELEQILDNLELQYAFAVEFQRSCPPREVVELPESLVALVIDELSLNRWSVLQPEDLAVLLTGAIHDIGGRVAAVFDKIKQSLNSKYQYTVAFGFGGRELIPGETAEELFEEEWKLLGVNPLGERIDVDIPEKMLSHNTNTVLTKLVSRSPTRGLEATVRDIAAMLPTE